MDLQIIHKYRRYWQHRSCSIAKSAFLSILLFLAACTSFIRSLGDLSPDATQQYLDDSLAIYTAILDEVYPLEKIHIIDQSTQPYRGDLDVIMENEFLPGLQQETAEEFETIREIPQELNLIFQPDEQSYILIDRSEFYVDRSEEGAPDCYWMMMKCFDTIKFNSYYPGSSGYIQLSNIAFNSNHTQALATVEMHNESTSGNIYVVLLNRQGNKWVITSKYELFWVV